MKGAAPRAVLIAAPLVVWFAYFALVWAFVELGCPLIARGVVPLDLGTLRTVLLVASIITAAVIAAIGWSGWGLQAKARRHAAGTREPAEPPLPRLDDRFAGLLTFLVALLAAVATVWTALPILMVPPCR